MIKSLALAAALCALAGIAFAQATPVGLWKTIDDETGKEKSFVRITEAAGVLSGKVEKIVDPAKQEQVCQECTDARKGQKVLGMTIIEGLKKNDDGTMWEGGTILDPNNGKVYKARMSLKDGGRTLDVRGFIGFALIGRTQTWQRAE